MSANVASYANDEDIALRASADFAILCPRDQCLAYGRDGVFSSDLWTLTSPSIDFQGNGLTPGHLVRLTQPVGVFKPPGDTFVAVSIAPNTVTLRRKGQPARVGQPPSVPGGVVNVEFTATTLDPQISRASYDLNRRYGIDDLVSGRRSCDMFDPTEVREATVLTVIYRQYLELSRGPQERVDTFLAKAQLYKQELDDLLARTIVHWMTSPGGPPSSQSDSRMSTRLSR